MPSISRANAATGVVGRTSVVAVELAAGVAALVAEQPVNATAALATPPTNSALRSGRPALSIARPLVPSTPLGHGPLP
ncbi:hypothetical protein AB0M29_15715 [Streptomyces sp. NPDC051976]|uniref:hypothetical protein n=1 Tax=Streptomyces sp. NPDC051976 TaxID=3154947 RepID=UPI0034251560